MPDRTSWQGLICLHRLVLLPEAEVGRPHKPYGIFIVRLQPYRLLEFGQGLGIFTQDEKSGREQVVRFGVLRNHPDHLPGRFDRSDIVLQFETGLSDHQISGTRRSVFVGPQKMAKSFSEVIFFVKRLPTAELDEGIIDVGSRASGCRNGSQSTAFGELPDHVRPKLDLLHREPTAFWPVQVIDHAVILILRNRREPRLAGVVAAMSDHHAFPIAGIFGVVSDAGRLLLRENRGRRKADHPRKPKGPTWKLIQPPARPPTDGRTQTKARQLQYFRRFFHFSLNSKSNRRRGRAET